MNKNLTIAMTTAMLLSGGVAQMQAQDVNIGKSKQVMLKGDIMTPETLWAMGRVGSAAASPDGKQVVYQVGYYSVKENRGHQVLFIMNADGTGQTKLTTDAKSESDPVWIEGGKRIAFLRGGQVWAMNPDGSGRTQLTKDATAIEGFKFSPDGSRVLLIKSLPYHGTIKKNPDDLPMASGRLVTDMNYRHWDHYVESIAHPFVAQVSVQGIDAGWDILEGQPYESPLAPFGGIEQFDWSPDSKHIAYTCRKKVGVDYAVSTDADIFLFNIETKADRNLCKPEGYVAPKINYTKSLRNQKVNHQEGDMNVGYDVNPRFSPDGKYVAWLSMEHDGYESDRNRLCVYELATGKKSYVAEAFDSNVDDYCWNTDSKTLYFIGCWHATVNAYQTNLKGEVKKLTEGDHNYVALQLLGNTGKLLGTRQSITVPSDLYVIKPAKKEGQSEQTQITFENKHIYDQMAVGNVTDRWVKTSDGKEMQVWIITPPHFDPNKKYPTLLFCEGGPQSPVSQFWSYRWNFQLMAAQGYVVVAPNRRGVPSFGQEWLDQISGDYSGQNIRDYLSAIDDVAREPWVDRDRLGCVGASYGGYSVYYLAGQHEGRFKAFISHCGIFDFDSMYGSTEELFFINNDYGGPYWDKENAVAQRSYAHSPHRFVQNWDTPILIITGLNDFRIPYTQSLEAFTGARVQGIPARFVAFENENHQVFQPQNSLVWNREFFGWLDKYVKGEQ